MKQLTTILLISALCAGSGLAQTGAKSTTAPKASATSSATVDEIKQIENDWAVAAKAKDAAKLSEILADSWTGIEWDGQIIDKAKSLADLKAPDSSLTTFEMGPMKVRVFGNTAIVTGSDTEKSIEKGKDTSGKYVWMDVFVKQNGKWQVVASESTKVAK